MDRNNYIEIHPTQAQVAKISYHHPSKYLNQIVSPQLHYFLFRIICLFSEKWVYKQVLNDHNLLCSLQCKKDYDHLKLACKPFFQKINTLYEKASIEVEEKLFDLDILMSGDIIALIFINFKSANIILNCYSKSPMLKVNTTDLIDI